MSPAQGSTVQREVEQMLRLSGKRDIGRYWGRVDDIRDEEVRKGKSMSRKLDAAGGEDTKQWSESWGWRSKGFTQ